MASLPNGEPPEQPSAPPVEARGPSSEKGPSPEEVRETLARVLATREFSASPRLAAFLTFVVEATLAGRAEEIKGYTIAVEALGRSASFDPQSDPIVRVEATRLRRALERHFASAGADEPLEIVIPKGGYVPLFQERRRPVLAPPPETPAAPAAEEPPPPPARRSFARWALFAAGFVVAAALGGLTIALSPLMKGEESQWPAWHADAADRMGLPVVEVRGFEQTGLPTPGQDALGAIESRLRDTFARFDFVDVKARGRNEAAGACRASPNRSVFTLDGFAENRGNDTFALNLRLTDRCEGSIVWADTFNDLKGGAGLAEAEQAVVEGTAEALMGAYGVIPTKARAQALLDANASGYGCVARAFAAMRGEAAGARERILKCLDDAIALDPGYGLVHAVKAAYTLAEIVSAPNHVPDTALVQTMTDEATLAADLAPSSSFAARTLALVELFHGERDAARSAVERAKKLNPLDADTLATAGMVLIGTGDPVAGQQLILAARGQGAARRPIHDLYLALSAYLTGDREVAAATLPMLELHPSIRNHIALALALHVLGREVDEREIVSRISAEAGGVETVRRALRYLTPMPEVVDRVVTEFTSMGLSQHATGGDHGAL